MAVMLSDTYAAFRDAGVSEDRARAAAEEIAGFESRLVRLEVKENLVMGGIVALLIGVATLVVRSFL